MHLEDGFSDESGAEEGPEGDEEVSAGDASQVEQRVRDLKRGRKGLVKLFLFPTSTLVPACVGGLLLPIRHPCSWRHTPFTFLSSATTPTSS